MEEGGEHLGAHTTALYAIIVVILVLGSGLMSGLTLGLLSLDVMDLEVLRVSGTLRQQSAAGRLIPLVAKPHWLLCTLLLCNAACMEALPMFLDRLLNPVAAILMSVTAILLFGEIIPQAVCSRYGVAIGSTLAPLVRVLMLLCAPITWPLGKVLDWVLGHENVTMKRQQLKAMVQLHGEGAGLGGKLTAQEVSVISGAIDLRYKTAISAMTPMSKVFMVSDQALLDEGLVRAMLHSGHSRVPVYRENDPTDFAGLILVKEVLQFWRCPESPRVSQLTMRPFPRLPADTPMFDMLRFFQTGNSHMALLTAPEGSDLEEFKRTKAFMLTRDEDDSSCSSSCTSSTSSSCCSSDDGTSRAGRSTTNSISSSIMRRLRKHTCSKRSKFPNRSSLDSNSHSPPAVTGSELCTPPCSSTCSSAVFMARPCDSCTSGAAGGQQGVVLSAAALAAVQQQHELQQQQHQQQHGALGKGLCETLPDGVQHALGGGHCCCQVPQQQQQQQQEGQPDGPLSNPLPVHHHHSCHHHHRHCHHTLHQHQCHHHQQQVSAQQQQQQQQQQQEDGLPPLPLQPLQPQQQHKGGSHLTLSIDVLEGASHNPAPLAAAANPPLLHHVRSGSSGSSSGRNPGSISATPAAAGKVAAAAAAEAAAAAAVGPDEWLDQLGPLAPSPQQQQQQQQHLSGQHSPQSAAGGVVRQVPVGIITLEDVIEELMQAEIVDETDTYMDNDKTKRVDLAQLMESLPPSMLATLRAEMLQAAQNFIKHASWAPLPALTPTGHGRQALMTPIRALSATTAGMGTAAAGLPAAAHGGGIGADARGGLRSHLGAGAHMAGSAGWVGGFEAAEAAGPAGGGAAGGITADGLVRRLSGTSNNAFSLDGGVAAAAAVAAAGGPADPRGSHLRVSSSPATLHPAPAAAAAGTTTHPGVLPSPAADPVAAALAAGGSAAGRATTRASAPGVLSRPQGW